MRRLVALGTLVVLVFAFPLPGEAAAPVRKPFTESGSEPVPCAGFDAILERHITGTEALYLDGGGQLVRVQVTATITGSITNTLTAKEVSLRGHVLFVADLVKGTATFDGQVFMANVPGRGNVIQDTGRFVIDADGDVIFEAGPHDAPTTGGQIFCDAVA